MIKVTLYTTDQECRDLGSFIISHIVIFEPNRMTLSFCHLQEKLKAIELFWKVYIEVGCQGDSMFIDLKQYHRVRFRFDSINSSERV